MSFWKFKSIKSKLRYLNAKFAFIIFVMSLFGMFSSYAYAEASTFNGPIELATQEFKEINISGPATLHAIKTNSLNTKGPVDFIKLKVKGKTEITGPFTGVDGEFGHIIVQGPFDVTKMSAESLKVEGPVALEDFKITGNVSINGPLKAKVGTFKDINTVNTPVALYDVKVNNIHVKKDSGMNKDDNADNPGYARNHEVKLAGKTIVTGNITFESGDGIVHIRDKTAQLKGKVIGGKIRE